MKNILFYKYVKIENLQAYRKQHYKLCSSYHLKGKVLIAQEGINGCVSGQDEDIDAYRSSIRKDSRFADIEFKITPTEGHTFKKLIVRIRDEIVNLKEEKVDLGKKGTYISPTQLKNMLDNNEKVVLVDVRNNYECNIGHFENAQILPIETFRQFPEAIETIGNLKNERIVIYCTGGIRCEKASAYLNQAGFSQVYQLKGGILNYGKECSTAHWQGKCFVFDTRGAIDIDPDKISKPITKCNLCNLPNDTYYNCKRTDCDLHFLSCKQCLQVLEGCCSKHCRNLRRKMSQVHALT